MSADLPARLRELADCTWSDPIGGGFTRHRAIIHEAADEIERLNAEVSRLQMECRQWRQAVDMATRRAVAAEESLKGDDR